MVRFGHAIALGYLRVHVENGSLIAVATACTSSGALSPSSDALLPLLKGKYQLLSPNQLVTVSEAVFFLVASSRSPKTIRSRIADFSTESYSHNNFGG